MPRTPRTLLAPRCLAAAVAFTLLPLAAHADRTKSEEEEDGARFACAKPKTSFEVGFSDEVSVKDLVTWAMGFSCKRFVYATGIAARSAKLTMVTPGKLDASEAWTMFEVGLEAMGLAAVAKGPVYEIVEAVNAKDAALAIRNRFPDGGNGVVRLLVRPAHVGVDDLRGALDLVKSKNGVVTPLPNLRALLITDQARHVARMRTLVDELDRPGDGAGVWAVPVTARDPEALATVLEPLLATAPATPGSAAATARAPKLVPDRRASALFVVGSAADYQRVLALVAVLDRDQGDQSTLTAVRLRNARAVEVVTALGPLTSGGGGESQGLSGPVKLAADDGTNAVLIQGSPADAQTVRAMLDELDAPRRQIYVEAMVLEVSEAQGRQLGVAWHAGTTVGDTPASGDPADSGLALGGFQTGTLSSVTAADSLATAGAGVIGGVLGSALTSKLLGESVPSFGALVQAVATASQVEVLASPHLMMLDNKPATISVGTNIPFIARQASESTIAATGASIDRKDVALTLKITPHVAPARAGDGPGDERIRLDISLEHNQLGESNFEGLGPTWKERKIETTVVVADQDNVVLGGLIAERVERSTTKIPLLGDLPLLGALFRSTKTSREKANLLIVLTPYLIDDSLAGRELFARRMREREEFLRARSALSHRAVAPRLDYRRKRGLIAEIDARVRAVDDERAARAALSSTPPPRGRVDEAPPVAPAATVTP